jgi:hypothetical protein
LAENHTLVTWIYHKVREKIVTNGYSLHFCFIGSTFDAKSLDCVIDNKKLLRGNKNIENVIYWSQKIGKRKLPIYPFIIITFFLLFSRK